VTPVSGPVPFPLTGVYQVLQIADQLNSADPAKCSLDPAGRGDHDVLVGVLGQDSLDREEVLNFLGDGIVTVEVERGANVLCPSGAKLGLGHLDQLQGRVLPKGHLRPVDADNVSHDNHLSEAGASPPDNYIVSRIVTFVKH